VIPVKRCRNEPRDHQRSYLSLNNLTEAFNHYTDHIGLLYPFYISGRQLKMSTQQGSQPGTQLRKIMKLLSTAVEEIASEWDILSSKGTALEHGAKYSHIERDAAKTALAAIGSLESLIQDPYKHLITMSTSYTIARALHIAADHHIAELLAVAGVEGVHVADLASSTGIEESKLSELWFSEQPKFEIL
jgi:hypothetical protein